MANQKSKSKTENQKLEIKNGKSKKENIVKIERIKRKSKWKQNILLLFSFFSFTLRFLYYFSH